MSDFEKTQDAVNKRILEVMKPAISRRINDFREEVDSLEKSLEDMVKYLDWYESGCNDLHKQWFEDLSEINHDYTCNLEINDGNFIVEVGITDFGDLYMEIDKFNLAEFLAKHWPGSGQDGVEYIEMINSLGDKVMDIVESGKLL